MEVVKVTHHHEFIDSPLVDAEPLQAHGLEEVAEELNANFDVGKAVDERAEIFGELLLHQRLVGHPHAVVEALPQAKEVAVGELWKDK
jgi:pyrimidine deaminase RibD-like protein